MTLYKHPDLPNLKWKMDNMSYWSAYSLVTTLKFIKLELHINYNDIVVSIRITDLYDQTIVYSSNKEMSIKDAFVIIKLQITGIINYYNGVLLLMDMPE